MSIIEDNAFKEINVDNFCDFEEENELLLDSFDGFAYWGYLRFDIFREIDRHKNKRDVAIYRDRMKVRDYLNIIYNITLKNPFLRIQKKELLLITHPRRLLENGKYKCIYTDFLNDYFKDICISAEFVYGCRHLIPPYSDNLLNLDYIDFLPPILFKIKSKYIKIEYFRTKAKKIAKLIMLNFGVQLDENDLELKLLKYYYYYKKRKRMILKLLKKISPQLIIEVVGYEFNKLILNEAAKELGIQTIELQHGVIGRGHIAYNFKITRNYTYLPDKLFVFSDYWKNTCNFLAEEKNVLSVGYPYLEEQKKKYPKIKLDEAITILVLSQPIYSSAIHDFVKKSLRYLNDADINYKIIYKLHPAEFGHNEELYSDMLENQKIEIINNSDHSLYYYFARSDIQLGVTSTAIFEGLSYQLQTYIINLSGCIDYMGELCNQGYAKMCNSVEDLSELVVEFASNRCRLEEKNCFFEENAKENIENEIKKLIF